jgi:hypothetical protein
MSAHGIVAADRHATLSAIAADLTLCDLGLAVTRGKLRRRYADHRRACLAEIERLSPIDPATTAMSADELLAELTA